MFFIYDNINEFKLKHLFSSFSKNSVHFESFLCFQKEFMLLLMTYLFVTAIPGLEATEIISGKLFMFC